MLIATAKLGEYSWVKRTEDTDISTPKVKSLTFMRCCIRGFHISASNVFVESTNVSHDKAWGIFMSQTNWHKPNFTPENKSLFWFKFRFEYKFVITLFMEIIQ
jgi:hypothetical protein